ncbi:glutathione transferase GstA [Microvirga terricola]|uniref:Glutathione transferase GstA n=1 Tax=Microvirga terricola TaxID=2719797 RepID=A0ABX0VDZ1_9HYPH|nr:glutathione transferase GstA [Microvirga terricola]NIX78047.1 glutathione transferase GstA [Microvirga terricola]
MKLYYAPGACSLAVHITAYEAGLPLTIEKVDLATRKTETGADFAALNPKGYVPALKLDDGAVMTEVAALVQLVADKNPSAKLAPANGTMERYRLQEWLAFISSEVHKGFSPLWNPATPEESKQAAKDRLAIRFAYLDKILAAQPFLTGSQFTVADAYLFTVVNWAGYLNIDISGYPNLKAFLDRVSARPKVREALVAEGLLQAAA